MWIAPIYAVVPNRNRGTEFEATTDGCESMSVISRPSLDAVNGTGRMAFTTCLPQTTCSVRQATFTPTSSRRGNLIAVREIAR